MASSTCPNCQAVHDAGTAECPSCGSPQSGVSPSAASGPVGPPPAPGPVGSPGAPAPSAKSQVKFDITLLSHTDRIVGIASLVLFIDLFLNWYSASVGAFGGGSANALTAHGYLYITLILTLVIVALLSAEALSLLKVPATSPVSRDQFSPRGHGHQPGPRADRVPVQAGRIRSGNGQPVLRHLRGADRRGGGRLPIGVAGDPGQEGQEVALLTASSPPYGR